MQLWFLWLLVVMRLRLRLFHLVVFCIALHNKCNTVLIFDVWLTFCKYMYNQTRYQHTKTTKVHSWNHDEYDSIRRKRFDLWFIKILAHNTKRSTFLAMPLCYKSSTKLNKSSARSLTDKELISCKSTNIIKAADIFLNTLINGKKRLGIVVFIHPGTFTVLKQLKNNLQTVY